MRRPNLDDAETVAPEPKIIEIKTPKAQTNTKSKVWSLFYKSLVLKVAAALFGTLVVTRIVNGIVGPEHYTIYFAGPISGGNGIDEVVQIFRNASRQSRSIGGVAVQIRTKDDAGEPAIAQQIATRLAAQNDTLLVVGHVYSTTTKEALPVYLQKAHPAIPVILTTETNPNILPPRNETDELFPIYRLSATDDVQAQSAYRFARDMGGKNFWIVEDNLANPVYSRYLAEQFMAQAQGQQTRVLLLSTAMSLPPVQTISQLGVDWVFFAGDWRGALVLIRTLRKLGLPNIRFLLSDGCATQELLDNATGELDEVFITHPLRAAEFTTKHYGVYAENTITLIDALLDSANEHFFEAARREGGLAYYMRWMLGIHRVQDARNALNYTMRSLEYTSFRLADGELAQFDRTGSRINGSYHVWKVAGGKFVDVK